MTSQGKAEYILEDVAGCGPFQIIFFFSVVFVIKSSVAYNILFMAFGNYNPGWRCLDNHNTSGPATVNGTELETTTVDVFNGTNEIKDYVVGKCENYRKCVNVEFNPRSSTIVTEWGLVCDKAWIVSLIISIQMVGMTTGAYLGGFLSDAIGRKKTVGLSLVMISASHFASSFSVSWIMLIFFRFLIGLFASSILVTMFLYMSEVMTRKWRAVTISVPMWYVGCTVLAFVAWLAKDWRRVDQVGAAYSAFCLIPLIFFAPESLRWLEVKKKRKEFISVSRKILKLNKKAVPSFDNWNFVVGEKDKEVGDKKYNVCDLFRKGYKMITVCILLLQFTFCMVYYALSFGAKSLYGDFYFNFFVMSIIPIPFNFLSMFVLRVMSRRWHSLLFLAVTAMLCIISILILQFGDKAAKDFGSSILISVAKSTLDVAWVGLYARNAELYPTVVRGLGVGVGSMAARIGAIFAPFLIPKDKSVLYIFMIIMAAATVVCGVISAKLPETKDKILKETFSDDQEDESPHQSDESSSHAKSSPLPEATRL